jgi:hypothetical protein
VVVVDPVAAVEGADIEFVVSLVGLFLVLAALVVVGAVGVGSGVPPVVHPVTSKAPSMPPAHHPRPRARPTIKA